jgi:hypothetical protein
MDSDAKQPCQWALPVRGVSLSLSTMRAEGRVLVPVGAAIHAKFESEFSESMSCAACALATTSESVPVGLSL